MNLTVPTTFTQLFLENLAGLNREFSTTGNRIYEIYGSFQSASFNSARPAKYLPAPDRKQFADHVRAASDLGIHFNYLFNAPSYANYEYTPEGQQELHDLCSYLADSGVRSVTVAVPFLADLIANRFPALEVVASTIGYVGAMRGIEQWIEAGAKRIVLDVEANRDFSFLRRACTESPVPLEVIANPVCIYQCHYKFNHYCVAAHGSQKNFSDGSPGTPYNQYYLNWCFLKKIANPGEFLKSPWLRPEDSHLWENVGINFFKMAGRGMPEEKIIALCRAYLARSFDGNLLDLLGWPHWLAFRQNADGTMLPPLDIALDNKKLAGFLEFFTQKEQDCRLGCTGCEYCTRWSQKALGVNDEGLLARYTENMQRNIRRLVTEQPSPEEMAAAKQNWQEMAARQAMK